MQYHVFCRKEDEKTTYPVCTIRERFFSVMDTYEKLGKPIQITEITIPAYSDSAKDEKNPGGAYRTTLQHLVQPQSG